jgi:hypothetical protein
MTAFKIYDMKLLLIFITATVYLPPAKNQIIKLFCMIRHCTVVRCTSLNRVVMGNNFTPVVASRNYAYATVAAYEVIAAGSIRNNTARWPGS